MKVGEGIWGQDLKIDPRLVHGRDTKIRVHKCTTAITDTVELVIADAKYRLALDGIGQFRPMNAGGAKCLLEYSMRMDVDCLGVLHGHRNGFQPSLVYIRFG